MRIPKGVGFAIFCLGLIAAEHALSKTGNQPRFTDPDLIALEKLGARAKRAMDNFVLRPRVPDSYNFVCSHCMHDEGGALLPRVARASVRIPRPGDVAAGEDDSQVRRPRYASLRSGKGARQAASIRRRIALRRQQFQHSTQSGSKLKVAESWDAELRR